jgi:hypothetical protein
MLAAPVPSSEGVMTDAMTLRDARAAYWRANDFGDDGGESLRWVPVKVLGLTLYIPNSDARRRAVRVHDLHHVVTGYTTDFIGEGEIGAWEVATGCARVPIALVINLAVVALVVPLAPRRMLAAWARGRATRNLYRAPYGDALLARRVDETRAELGTDRPAPRARVRDAVGLGAAWLAGVALLLAPFAALAYAALRLR